MKVLFLSDSGPALECNLIVPDTATVNIDWMFLSFVSLCLGRDHFPHEYYPVIQSMLQFFDENGQPIREDDVDILCTIVFPLTAFPDPKYVRVMDLPFVLSRKDCVGIPKGRHLLRTSIDS
jgi:hypothetical protein